MSRMMLRFYASCAWLAATILLSSSLVAGLIFNPAGDVLFDGADQFEWDSAKLVTGLDFRFYSRNVSEIWVSENGNLNFSPTADDFFPDPLGDPRVARIAPLWDDFLLLQPPSNFPQIDNRVRVDKLATRLVVTWENVRLKNETVSGQPFPSTTRTAQVVIFQTDQSVNNFEFKRNDIAFSYIPHELGTDNFGANLFATVGLDSGTDAIAELPSTTNGLVTAANDGLLAWEENSFILFRPNDSVITNYTGSKQFFSAVPEPSAMTLCALAFILASARYRQRV